MGGEASKAGIGPAGEHSYGSHDDHGGRDGDSWEIYKDLYSLYLYICRELNSPKKNLDGETLDLKLVKCVS